MCPFGSGHLKLCISLNVSWLLFLEKVFNSLKDLTGRRLKQLGSVIRSCPLETINVHTEFQSNLSSFAPVQVEEEQVIVLD